MHKIHPAEWQKRDPIFSFLLSVRKHTMEIASVIHERTMCNIWLSLPIQKELVYNIYVHFLVSRVHKCTEQPH